MSSLRRMIVLCGHQGWRLVMYCWSLICHRSRSAMLIWCRHSFQLKQTELKKTIYGPSMSWSVHLFICKFSTAFLLKKCWSKIKTAWVDISTIWKINLSFKICTKTNILHNLSIYNMIHLFAGSLEQINHRPSVQCSKYYFSS